MQPTYKTYRDQEISIPALFKATEAELTTLLEQRKKRMRNNLIFATAVAAIINIPLGILTLWTAGSGWPLLGIGSMAAFAAGIDITGREGKPRDYAFKAAQNAVSKWAKKLSAEGDDIGAGTRDNLIEYLSNETVQRLDHPKVKKSWLPFYNPA